VITRRWTAYTPSLRRVVQPTEGRSESHKRDAMRPAWLEGQEPYASGPQYL